MPIDRVKSYVVRRLLDFDGEGCRFQFVQDLDGSGAPTWVDERIDAATYTLGRANEVRELVRPWSRNNMCVVAHSVVEA